ncbi:hypothetical protein LA080_016333 [Diaporthe eres]|uniref:FYVE-type domain-containing protein n=1 Tax=Diaporthe vaccinii TaxID=105482 RepID=A0ABR4EK37_9PEZI|nr:hypothetical protein LA080_016333 [Diaporthe eres]
MAMADLVMPRLPDQQQSFWHRQPAGHQRSFSYHMPQPQPQPQSQFHHALQHQYPQQQQKQQQQQQQRQPTPPQSQPLIQQSSDISPLSTSNSTSPVSPKNYHGRQVRPLYVPAVLRPNEYPSDAQRPIASPKGDRDDDERVIRSSGSFTSLFGISTLSRLSRRSTGDSAKVVDWDWDLANYPQVHGQPTRKHWKSDADSEVCDDPTCKKYFNYFVRRHHCRRCGNIFCDPHSNYEVPLDESANYNPRGLLSRSCAHCYGDFKVWRSRNSSDASSAGQRSAKGSQTVPASPISASPAKGSPTTPGKAQAEVAVSVPSDWNWSTF